MAWDLAALVEYVRLPARVYAAGFITSAVLLFVPARGLRLISLDGFATEHRTVIGFAFLASGILVATEIGLQVYGRAKKRRDARAAEEAERKQREETRVREEREQSEASQARLQRLATLTADEKRMLQPFVINNVRSRRLPYNSGTRHALTGNSILAAAAQTMDYDGEMDDYAIQSIIQPWALDELRKHPELVDLTPQLIGVSPKRRTPKR